MSDQVLFRQAISSVLREEGYQVTDQATTASLRAKRPDVALVDLSNAVTDGTLLVDDLHDQLPGAQLILIGTAIRLAASIDGHQHDGRIELPKTDLATLLRVIDGRTPANSNELNRAAKQWSQITARQRDVMRLLAHGHDNPGIAAKLRVGTRAIKAHISALLALFSLDSRTQLALLAREGGLLPPGR